MATKVFIPTVLRRFTGNQESLEIEGKTVREVLTHLVTDYGDLKKHLYDKNGRLRSFVNIYVNDEDIRTLQKEETQVTEEDTLTIVPSIAGGKRSTGRPACRSGRDAYATTLTNEEIQRYSRHLIMPEVGVAGQEKLKAAKVILVGTGGLGSPLGLYLAAAGVGRMGLVDFDVVDFSNLQRQILFSTEDVGKSKIERAKVRLQGINNQIEIKTYETRFTSENALEIMKDYDIVVDGTDNFPTRYLVNDACVLSGKPNVYGSIFRFEGQVSVFDAKRGPCYRCLYPEPPPPGLVPSCAEGGVLGVLPGVIGNLQALEVIKLILGNGKPLIGRLLLFDALRMEFRELKLQKNPDCPICGDHPIITQLIDYEEFCGVDSEIPLSPSLLKGEQKGEWEITAEELKERIDRGEEIEILDVREPHEYEICRIEGSHLIPLGQIPHRVSELDTADTIVAHCHRGIRSAEAVKILRGLGFQKVKSLQGGIDAWSEKVDPSVPRY
ncbi:molybdopterin-synthase adenylyltransferase MoeB [candidate division TA06 bacterium]|nr:molybdopterin-synthase adenylyltransferase MoeB [candidate division TA06 bacterium]